MTSDTSPTFILASIVCSAGASSSTLIGPIRPPLRLRRRIRHLAGEPRERFARQQTMPNVLRLRLGRIILRNVDAAIGRRNRDQDFAQHQFGRRGEFVLVRLVIRVRLVLGDADLGEHLVLLHARLEHVLLELPPQIGQRHPFLLQRLLELFVGVDVVVLLDVVENALELLVAHDVAELAAALDEQQLVDGAENQLRRAFRNRLLEFGAVGGDVLKIGTLPQELDLHPLEIAFGDDVAVHLDEHLLEDFGTKRDRDTERDERRRRQRACFIICNSLESNILTQRGPSSSSRRSNMPPSARGILLGFPQDLLFREPCRHDPGGRTCRPP